MIKNNTPYIIDDGDEDDMIEDNENNENEGVTYDDDE